MSGHSKWSTIKHKKGAQDAKRGKLFTKIIREIIVAVKEGGGDPDANNRLRAAMALAKSANMPKDTLQRAIERGLGNSDTDTYTTILYEGYAHGGVALIVQALTDNKNRTAADVRNAFNKNGGNLGENGSVRYLFEHKGVINIARDNRDEDAIMELALQADIDDYEFDDDIVTFYTEDKQLMATTATLEQLGVTYERSVLAYIPTSPVTLSDELSHKVLKLIDTLEELDDIQEVYTTLEYEESPE